MMWVRVTEYDYRNGFIRWQISTSIKVVFNMFAPAVTVSDILTFAISDHEKVANVTEYYLINGVIE